MKGIVLAGGAGTRLHPLTLAVGKQLVPIYDKPMIYYPLSVLMLMDIREILIISTPEDTPTFKALLGDGRDLGISFSYATQPKPEGLAQAFVIGDRFIGEDQATLILGDNLFYGHGLGDTMRKATQGLDGAVVFGYHVNDPERYGVVEFAPDGKVVGLEEKPKNPKSNYAVPGLYLYDNDVVGMAKALRPSVRGEYEITDLNRAYLERGKLKVQVLGRGTAWLDTGTYESLLEASNFVHVIERRQGLKIGCIEEVALNRGFIGKEDIARRAEALGKSTYAEYLRNLVS